MTAHDPETILEPSDEWRGILDPDENILWQGRPLPGAPVELAKLGRAAGGLLFAGFAVVWMASAMRAGGMFWMLGLIHFSLGLLIAMRALFWSRIKRSNTWYTLTDRRAFVATSIPLQGPKLKSWEINADTVLTLDEGPPTSVGFGFEKARGRSAKKLRAVGFEQIPDGRAVYDMMRKIRQRSLDAELRAKEDPR